ncbi:MAG: hypothetical protein ING77_14610 [Rhodocyclaceae bacterium]|nr:hypothetical protein [Rhodocyclaceae bacterium]MCA3074794.1 hypothetical protein [Rhodocyclaceae bacterium]MCA3088535.1 hypothetical protein [Rhodocyclaceae bacterium]MCA3094435.1 hypothetical protein [Rhodocyclaceae bacterium]MCA3099987.1 hypothetical protein [Rhodocyclaceae bacterium]
MIERVTGRGAVAASVYPRSRTPLHSSAIGCACGLLLLTTGPAFSQAFPAKPIRLVIPFAVGGSSDANARIVTNRHIQATRFSAYSGQYAAVTSIS